MLIIVFVPLTLAGGESEGLQLWGASSQKLYINEGRDDHALIVMSSLKEQ